MPRKRKGLFINKKTLLVFFTVPGKLRPFHCQNRSVVIDARDSVLETMGEYAVQGHQTSASRLPPEELDQGNVLTVRRTGNLEEKLRLGTNYLL